MIEATLMVSEADDGAHAALSAAPRVDLTGSSKIQLKILSCHISCSLLLFSLVLDSSHVP